MKTKLVQEYKQLKSRSNDYPNRLEDYLSIFVLVLLVLDVSLQVITRYVFNKPLGWTEEIARYLLILLTFVGGPIAARKNSNVSLDFMLVNAPCKTKKLLGTITDVIELFFYGVGTYLSIKMALFSVKRFLVTIKISKAIVFGIIAFCFALMTIRCLVRLIRRIKEPVLEEK